MKAASVASRDRQHRLEQFYDLQDKEKQLRIEMNNLHGALLLAPWQARLTFGLAADMVAEMKKTLQDAQAARERLARLMEMLQRELRDTP